MLKTNSDIFLDDKTVSDVEQALGIEIMPVATDGYELLDAILGKGRIYETEKRIFSFLAVLAVSGLAILTCTACMSAEEKKRRKRI